MFKYFLIIPEKYSISVLSQNYLTGKIAILMQLKFFRGIESLERFLEWPLPSAGAYSLILLDIEILIKCLRINGFANLIISLLRPGMIKIIKTIENSFLNSKGTGFFFLCSKRH